MPRQEAFLNAAEWCTLPQTQYYCFIPLYLAAAPSNHTRSGFSYFFSKNSLSRAIVSSIARLINAVADSPHSAAWAWITSTQSFIRIFTAQIIIDIKILRCYNTTNRMNNSLCTLHSFIMRQMRIVNYSATSYRASCFNHRCLAIRNVLPSLTQCPQALGWASS